MKLIIAQKRSGRLAQNFERETTRETYFVTLILVMTERTPSFAFLH